MSDQIEYKRKIGQRIKELVGEERGAKAALCRAINVEPTNLSNYFNGNLPDPDILVKISDYFGVSLDFLIAGRSPSGETIPELPLSGEEKRFLALYRSADHVGRDDAIFLLERHRVSAKKKAGQ